jgi:hypothetical protein
MERMEKKPRQVKHKFLFRRLANTTRKINKKYTKCKTILFLLPSISFYQQIKCIHFQKKKVRIFKYLEKS